MCNCDNPYIPCPAEIIEITKHTDIEWTFRVKADTSKTKPGQFYEISLPKFGESPISVSGIGPDFIDFTIRAVGRVTNEIFEYKIGDKLFIRGPYGNGFDLNEYVGKDLVIVVGGSALAPVRGIIQFVYNNPEKVKSFKLIAGVVVGPPMMMKFSVAEFLKLNVAEKNIWVSYERNMHCGIGKCGHCKMDATYICLDGPVFDYEFAKNLVD